MPCIYVDKSAERGLVERALAKYPCEYMEVIFGTRKGGNIYVHSFQPIEHRGTRKFAEYATLEELEDDKTLEKMETIEDLFPIAKEHGVKVLGIIHSHVYPDPAKFSKCDTMPSYGDMETDAREGWLVGGIILIRRHPNGRKYVKTDYWPRHKRFTKRFYD